ncbi:hypothetical protein D2V17_16280 [Aurantiacibacter xanthus]|uniref:Uncharacterized protein n=1 Tax=Aurantiacibacter xanthus TaxID=1784712 RepID=A0A3A1P1T4_9SPHN|nr:hypothetical protein [Aurantiacibacter xanthus]RIV81948.1 hypothetical protein D2V17_16280 [Aurantiacibacter xanthus]
MSSRYLGYMAVLYSKIRPINKNRKNVEKNLTGQSGAHNKLNEPAAVLEGLPANPIAEADI